jgi:hypothetical protein
MYITTNCWNPSFIPSPIQNTSKFSAYWVANQRTDLFTNYIFDSSDQHFYYNTSICVPLYSPFVKAWPLFQFLKLCTVGRVPRSRVQPVARPLPTQRTAQTQTSIPRMGFGPTISVFERAKTVNALNINHNLHTHSYGLSLYRINSEILNPRTLCRIPLSKD